MTVDRQILHQLSARRLIRRVKLWRHVDLQNESHVRVRVCVFVWERERERERTRGRQGQSAYFLRFVFLITIIIMTKTAITFSFLIYLRLFLHIKPILIWHIYSPVFRFFKSLFPFGSVTLIFSPFFSPEVFSSILSNTYPYLHLDWWIGLGDILIPRHIDRHKMEVVCNSWMRQM